MSERRKGYVTGSRNGPEGREVWSVREKDPQTGEKGQTLTVASVRGGLQLARGLNVTFLIGTVDDEEGRRSPRAVDVCLE